MLKDTDYNQNFDAVVVRNTGSGYEMIGTAEVDVSGEYDFELFDTCTNKGVATVNGVRYEYDGKYDKPINPFSIRCSVNNNDRDENGYVVWGDFSAKINGRSAKEMVISIADFEINGNSAENEFIYIVCGANDIKEAEKIIKKLIK